MEGRYIPENIEGKWQKKWEEQGTFRQYGRERKFYALDMFPYPSGAGLHVGHPKGYIATDVIARMKQLQGYAVLHPMGWDAFGLPAEQYAIKNKTHPSKTTRENVATFKGQLGRLGFTYDWDREINTTDPEYYKWTQWIFLQMLKKGLAYESYEPIIWCPSCQTGLANEDLENGACERCGTIVEKKPMRQWVLRITDYADRLLEGLGSLDWPESIKESQRNWIGRSEGTVIRFQIINPKLQFPNKSQNTDSKSQTKEEFIEVFTTRVDTLYGCTYVVVAPEHPLIREQLTDNSEQIAEIKNWEEVRAYIEETKKKTEMERTAEGREKTGVRLEGIMAVNPINGEEVPVFVADYVLGDYGTGAVMAVPAHDTRDFAFAKKYDLPIKNVIMPHLTDKKNPPREGKKSVERNTIHALVRNPKDGKFLCLEWKNHPWTTFIVGGVEDGEDIVEAAKREVLEETGFSNLRHIGTLDRKVRSEYFAAHKDENRVANTTAVLFELEDESRESVTEEEVAKHSVLWLSLDEIRNREMTCAELDIWLGWLEGKDDAFVDDGALTDSSEFSGLSSEAAREKINAKLEADGNGKKVVKYKLREWVFSRQRYWGEPIPVVHCEKCGVVPVPENELPVFLPDVESYEPTGTGESPLAAIESWVNTTCPTCGGPAKRETNTMPQWAGSSWYYLRYIDPLNQDVLVGKELEKEWMPVDVYVGGAEHATRHLIYARFWHKFLFDIGAISTDEPFRKLCNVGLILASDGRKMSKRWGNVVNPDDMVRDFGADAMRLYEMFMGPFNQNISWNTDGVVGTRRFLEKVWKLQNRLTTDNLPPTTEESGLTTDNSSATSPCADPLAKTSGQPTKIDCLLHRTIVKVMEDIEAMRFNTAVSTLMILVNAFEKEGTITKESYGIFLLLLSPFAPHIAEELWAGLGNPESIFLSTWPVADLALLVEDTVKIVVSVNGKVRDTFEVPADATEDDLKAKAFASDKIAKFLDGREPKRVIVVPGKLVNVVV
ncbi:MAG: class I tRNA ligase family protein [Candidatus Moraniibacteriota bacterium]